MEEAKEIWEILKEVGKRLDNVGKRLDRLAKSQEETDKKIKELAESQKETDKMLKETRELVENLAKRQEETDKMSKELAENQAGTDGMLKEAREILKETDKKLKEIAEKQQKNDEQIEKLSVQINKVAKEVRNTNKAIAQLNGLWQNYTEETIREGLEYALKDLGLEGFKVITNMKVRKGDDNMEIDGLVMGDDYVIVLEVKTTLRVKDVRGFVKKLKEKFLEFFPEYKGYRLYGAIAGMRFQEGVSAYANKKGLIVLKHKDGKDVKVLNPKGFKPKDFSGL